MAESTPDRMDRQYRTKLIPCPACHGAAEMRVEFEVIPKERPTWSAPGSPAYVNVLSIFDRECACPVSDTAAALVVADLLTEEHMYA